MTEWNAHVPDHDTRYLRAHRKRLPDPGNQAVRLHAKPRCPLPNPEFIDQCAFVDLRIVELHGMLGGFLYYH